MNDKKSGVNLVVGLVIGLTIGALIAFFIVGSSTSESSPPMNSPSKKEPLYWVAPMDPNYRRDKPGQSPMGMDLIPYYGDEDSIGTVRISPDVINNLGVRTQQIVLAKGKSTITGMGIVQYDEERLFHIHPRVEGWIEKLYIKSSGEEVAKNQPLYDIYSPQLVNAQEELLLALKRNDRRLIKAAEERLVSLQFSNQQIKTLKKNKLALQRVTFYSPNHGVVENLRIREGFFVKPGDTLMSIGALDNVWVEVDILEKQASMIRLSQPATMKLDYAPGENWTGVVDFIHPTLDPKTRTLKVRLRFINERGLLKPNMFARVNLEVVTDSPKLLVPGEAVIRTGNSDRVVLALGDGKFKSINVTLGYSYGDFIEVLDGLTKNDIVVTSAQFLLDSESSKTSDFKRMNHEMDHSQMDHSPMKDQESNNQDSKEKR